MAKKIVRGITDVKTINNQDYDTNNVNDLLSDGQYSYIHRKKGKSEEYRNLTDNIKTISSDNTDLLAVTNNNKTTNSATLHPKHDAQKEQVLQSTRNTVTINHGTNGTPEKTTVDTNPQKVLEHENLISNSQYVTVEHEEDSNTSEIKTDKLDSKLVELDNKIPTEVGVRNLWIQSKAFGGFSGFVEEMLPDNHVTGQKKCYRIPNGGELAFNIEPDFSSRLYRKVTFSAWVKYENVVQGPGDWNAFNCFKHQMVRRNSLTHDTSTTDYTTLGSFTGTSDWKYITYTYDYTANKSYDQIKTSLRFNLEGTESGTAWVTGIKVEYGSIPSDYTPALEDTQEQINSLNSSLSQKQNTIQSNTSIGASGNGLRQLYTLKQTYTHTNATLKTHVKSVSSNTSVTTPEEEFNFILKINKGSQEATFTLNEDDKTHFSKIITAYGVDSTVRINDCLFTLSDSTLTVTTDVNTGSNLVITFSDII